jgi:hypothetical protein
MVYMQSDESEAAAAFAAAVKDRAKETNCYGRVRPVHEIDARRDFVLELNSLEKLLLTTGRRITMVTSI